MTQTAGLNQCRLVASTSTNLSQRSRRCRWVHSWSSIMAAASPGARVSGTSTAGRNSPTVTGQSTRGLAKIRTGWRSPIARAALRAFSSRARSVTGAFQRSTRRRQARYPARRTASTTAAMAAQRMASSCHGAGLWWAEVCAGGASAALSGIIASDTTTGGAATAPVWGCGSSRAGEALSPAVGPVTFPGTACPVETGCSTAACGTVSCTGAWGSVGLKGRHSQSASAHHSAQRRRAV